MSIGGCPEDWQQFANVVQYAFAMSTAAVASAGNGPGFGGTGPPVGNGIGPDSVGEGEGFCCVEPSTLPPHAAIAMTLATHALPNPIVSETPPDLRVTRASRSGMP